MSVRQKCSLYLKDGRCLATGELIGAPVSSGGELVFTTAMMGYTEALTDPSYYGQVLIFTYPLLGNYGVPRFQCEEGVPPQGFESAKIQTAAVIMGSHCDHPSHWQSVQTLDQWLKQNKIPGIAGVDTRQLTHAVREGSNVMVRVEPEKPEGRLFEDFFDPGCHEVIGHVSRCERRVFAPCGKAASRKLRIALIDCGVKWNMVRLLQRLGCEVEVLPWNTDLKIVACDGWLISNGPGDPTMTGDLIDRVSFLLKGDKPILGICLGHQILALASGARTKRMPYGHRGYNQPVALVGTKRGFLSTQNHGYVVEQNSLSPEWEPWFLNANDHTLEGIRHSTKPFRSVQFHPEASGGPHDTTWVLEEFVKAVSRGEYTGEYK